MKSLVKSLYGGTWAVKNKVFVYSECLLFVVLIKNVSLLFIWLLVFAGFPKTQRSFGRTFTWKRSLPLAVGSRAVCVNCVTVCCVVPDSWCRLEDYYFTASVLKQGMSTKMQGMSFFLQFYSESSQDNKIILSSALSKCENLCHNAMSSATKYTKLITTPLSLLQWVRGR